MGTWSKIILTGSTNGQGISVTGVSATNANTIHTAATGTGGLDEVVLYAHSIVTTARELTVFIGPTNQPKVVHTVPAGDRSGLHPILPGLPVNNGLTVKAFVTGVGAITLWGWANRYAT